MRTKWETIQTMRCKRKQRAGTRVGRRIIEQRLFRYFLPLALTSPSACTVFRRFFLLTSVCSSKKARSKAASPLKKDVPILYVVLQTTFFPLHVVGGGTMPITRSSARTPVLDRNENLLHANSKHQPVTPRRRRSTLDGSIPEGGACGFILILLLRACCMKLGGPCYNDRGAGGAGGAGRGWQAGWVGSERRKKMLRFVAAVWRCCLRR